MTSDIPTNATAEWHISQWLDGVLQYDPLCGSRDTFGTFIVPYGQHQVIERWISGNTTGLVCSTYKGWRKHRGRTWFHTDVTFEFQNNAEAVLAKLTFGGDQ